MSFNQFFTYTLAGLISFVAAMLRAIASRLVFLARKILGLKVIVLFNNKTSGGLMLSVDKPIMCSLAESDQFGNLESVAPDAVPVWSLADDSLGALSVAADGMSATCIPSGKLGHIVVQCSLSVAGAAINASGEDDLAAGAVTSVKMVLSQ